MYSQIRNLKTLLRRCQVLTMNGFVQLVELFLFELEVINEIQMTEIFEF